MSPSDPATPCCERADLAADSVGLHGHLCGEAPREDLRNETKTVIFEENFLQWSRSRGPKINLGQTFGINLGQKRGSPKINLGQTFECHKESTWDGSE